MGIYINGIGYRPNTLCNFQGKEKIKAITVPLPVAKIPHYFHKLLIENKKEKLTERISIQA